MPAQAPITIVNVNGGKDSPAVSEVLRTAGFRVEDAATADAAARLAAGRPGLVILSPGPDAPPDEQLFRQLKDNPATASVPVLQLVNASATHFVERADGYLVQPVDPVELLAMVKSLLRLQQAEAAARQAEQRYRSVVEGSLQGILIHQDGIIRFANPALARMFGYSAPEELVGLHTDLLIAPEDRPTLEARRRAVLGGEAVTEGHEWQGVRRDGSRLWVQSTVSTIPWDGRPAVLSLRIDVTERKRADLELRTRLRQQAAVAELSQRALTAPDLDALLREAVARVVEGLGVEFSRVMELVPDGSALQLRAGVGWKEGVVGRTTVGAGDGSQSGYALLANSPVAVEDLAAETRFVVPELLPAHGVVSSLTVVIPGQSRPFGVLGAESVRRRTFTADDIYFVQTVANLLAAAVEHRRAQEFLRESERRLRMALDAARMGVWDWDDATGRMAWSEQLERMHGVAPGTFAGTREAFAERVHPEDRARVAETLARAVRTRTGCELEYRSVWPGGGVRWIAAKGSAWEGEAGGRLVGVAMDVTERRQAEERLRDSERYYRVLFESHPNPMWVYDPETLAFLAVNDAAVRHYGYSRDEFLRLTLKDIRPPEDEPHFLKSVESRHGTDRSTVWRHRKKDGTLIDVEISAHPLAFAGRRAELVLINDVTERREADEERTRLLRERAKLADHLGLLLESTGEGIAGMDPEGRCTFINRAAAKMLGYSPAELLGKKVHPAFHHSHADGTPYPEEDCPINRALQKGQGCQVDNEVFWRRDNSPFPVEYSSHPIIEEGALRGAVITFVDITERKRLEEQFRQAQKMEAVGRLAGGVAHDFNNLLTIISGYSELILGNLRAGEPLYQHMKEIKSAATRAAALTSQLLAFSRKQIIAPKVLDLNAVVADMNKMMYRLLGEDVQLEVHADPELGRVKADPGQLHQIILNLAVNARDAMPQGGKLIVRTANVELDELYARAHLGVRPGPHVLLEMTDTGTGMTEDVRSHIFEPFFTTKEAGKGTGLGLSTVYGIVQASGGHIAVRSQLGEGSTFTIYLPRVDQQVPREEAEQPQARAARGSETVLVVEDEDMVRNLIRMILRWNGYTVLEARRGAEALHLLEQHKRSIQLLLTDVIMPEMNGAELARRVTEQRPDIKVLYMSGYTGGALDQAGIDAVEAAFIQKPFTPEALARAVRDVLDK